MNDVYHKLTDLRLSWQAVISDKSLHPRRNGRLLHLMDSDAIQTLTFKSGTTPRLTTTRSYDTSDRLDGITNTYGSSQTQSFGVSEFDDLNRRKKNHPRGQHPLELQLQRQRRSYIRKRPKFDPLSIRR